MNNAHKLHPFDREFDLKQDVELPTTPSRPAVEPNRGSAFGDWDIRRENIVRQTEPTSTHQVDRYVDSSSDDDELENTTILPESLIMNLVENADLVRQTSRNSKKQS